MAAIGWLALLGVQLVGSYLAYFLTGWDAKLVLQNAYAIGIYGGGNMVEQIYYSIYPSNVATTLIFAAVLRVFRWIVGGESGIERCALVLIAFQCVLRTLTGVLCVRVARVLTGSRRFGAVVGAVYVALVGLSPWVMIPYTDGMALIFPTASLYCYACMRNAQCHTRRWCATLCVVTALGYLCKPTCAIVGIAVLLIETLRLLHLRRVRQWLVGVVCCVGGFALLTGPVYQGILRLSPFDLDADRRLGMLHFAMVGLNDESIGRYTDEDAMRSIDIEDSAERIAMQRETIAQRLREMGVSGYVRLSHGKALLNYADGTFSWGYEGNFYHTLLADKDTVLSPWLKDWLYAGRGTQYPKFATGMQCVWLGLLLGCVLLAWGRGQSVPQRDIAAVLNLTLIGAMLYVQLFEARARYLYIFAPLFVLCGVRGWWHALMCMIRRAKGGKRA